LSNQQSDTELLQKQRLLNAAIEEGEQGLLAGIRVYLWKFKVCKDRAAMEAASKEVLQDTVKAALSSANNYDPDRPASAWLLGVAINQIRRLRRTQNYDRLHIVPVGEILHPASLARQSDSDSLSDDTVFDLIRNSNRHPFAQSGPSLEELLSGLTEDEKEVLKLAYIEGLRGKSLAARLGVSEGLAWARLSRARTRLRKLHSEPGEN
jgi:RNA polymerase sigma factor (sigma-70 family)